MLLWALSYEFPDWVGEWAVIQTQRSPLRKRLWWFLQAGSPGGTAGPWRGELIPLCHNLQLMSAPRLSSLSLCLCSFVSKTIPMYRHTIICQGCIAESHTQIGKQKRDLQQSFSLTEEQRDLWNSDFWEVSISQRSSSHPPPHTLGTVTVHSSVKALYFNFYRGKLLCSLSTQLLHLCPSDSSTAQNMNSSSDSDCTCSKELLCQHLTIQINTVHKPTQAKHLEELPQML